LLTSGSGTFSLNAFVQSATDQYPFGMAINSRSFAAGRYRYGFQGHEKDDEIKGEGNSIDLGARMYDTRLGRTMSPDPMAHIYPMFSPYSGFGNNPLTITDPDGKLRRDANGNLIVVEAGKGEIKTKTINIGAYTDASRSTPILIKMTYKEVYVIANDGQKIKAELLISQEFVVLTANGTVSVDANSQKMLAQNLDATSNCHGVTVANGQLNIYSEDIGDEMLDETEFKTTKEADATVVVFTDGKKVTHSAKKSGNTYTVGDGATKTKTGDKNTASVNGKYKNPQCKKEVVKKSDKLSTGGNTSKKGLRVFTEKEYKSKTGG